MLNNEEAERWRDNVSWGELSYVLCAGVILVYGRRHSSMRCDLCQMRRGIIEGRHRTMPREWLLLVGVYSGVDDDLLANEVLELYVSGSVPSPYRFTLC